jgi:hypothetical protein
MTLLTHLTHLTHQPLYRPQESLSPVPLFYVFMRQDASSGRNPPLFIRQLCVSHASGCVIQPKVAK